MDIVILDSWLRDFLKTETKPREIGRYLSLCGPSVERVIKKGQDWSYHIEITSNRPDMASVVGIAREAAAILPRFGLKARLFLPKIKEPLLPKKSLPLRVKINPSSICPRFSAIVLDKVIVKPSPTEIRYRLEQSGIRALNNVVDIANYLMIQTGQPIHTFDYDKIGKKQMIVRLSKKGEKVTTLDGITRALPGDDIVIEDGKKRLIDLCGIMGGENSAIDVQTKRVLFFVQSYDPVRIRRTSMFLAHRTEAAERFEKGVDEETILSVIYQGVAMNQKLAGAQIASRIYDFYPPAQKINPVKVGREFINARLGVNLTVSEIKAILTSLDFRVAGKKDQLLVTPPSWRAGDIKIPEDLVEEVARLYGYHQLPSFVPVDQPPRRAQTLLLRREQEMKKWLKNWGFTEIYHYSMVSQEWLEKTGFDPLKCLKLSSPLTEEWAYLRPSLIPSLLAAASLNQDNYSSLKIFEIANIYLPRAKKLPEEQERLTGIINGQSFYQAKGVVEVILTELGIISFSFLEKKKAAESFWHSQRQAQLTIEGKPVGTIGEINPLVSQKFGLKKRVTAFDLLVEDLVKKANFSKTYTPISQYPPIIEDFSFILQPQTPIGEIIQLIKKIDLIIKRVELVSSYQNTRTLRITYQSPRKTLTDQEVKKVRENIIKQVQQKFKAKLKKLV